MKRTAILTLLCILCSMISYAQGHDIQSLKAKAEQGDAKSQYDLYSCYINGNSVKRDTVMAVNYLIQAADNDYPAALYRIGWCYKYGKYGLPIWKEKATDYLFRASELGHRQAREELRDLTKEFNYVKQGIRNKVYTQSLSIGSNTQSAFQNKKGTNPKHETVHINMPRLIRRTDADSFLSLCLGIGWELHSISNYLKKDPYYKQLESLCYNYNYSLSPSSGSSLCLGANYARSFRYSPVLIYVMGIDINHDKITMKYKYKRRSTGAKIGLNRWDMVIKGGFGINADHIYMIASMGVGFRLTNKWINGSPIKYIEPHFNKIATPPDPGRIIVFRPALEIGFYTKRMQIGYVLSSDLAKDFNPVSLLINIGFRINTSPRRNYKYNY